MAPRTAAIVVALAIPTAVSTASPAPDANAVAVVRAYVSALQKTETDAAFALLTPPQKRYFGNVRNFASNFATTRYRVASYSIAKTTTRNANLVQVDVAQKVSYFDISTEQMTSVDVVEPYFALRTSGKWGVKELFQPWKSYAPHAVSSFGGLDVIVNRIEFFDHRIQVDCTLRNLGAKAVQVLPLLKSFMRFSPGSIVAAMNAPDFPLNDRQFFEGVRIYPNHQVVGYVNFALPSRVDADASLTLTIAPAIVDGSDAPFTVTIGPMKLSRW